MIVWPRAAYSRKRSRRILIAFGSSPLAERLRRRHAVTVVDQRADRIDALRSALPELSFVNGDGCEPAVLDAADAAHADIVCALTGDDEDNLVVSLLSKRAGAKKVVARVNHPNNHWLFTPEWGADIALCAADIIYDLVDKEIGLSDVVTVMALKAQDVEVEELLLPPDAAADGRSLSDLPVPAGMHVMAVLSKEEGGAPRAAGLISAIVDVDFKWLRVTNRKSRSL